MPNWIRSYHSSTEFLKLIHPRPFTLLTLKRLHQSTLTVGGSICVWFSVTRLGYFEALGNKSSYKSSPNIPLVTFGLLNKTSLYKQKLMWPLFGQRLEKIGFFSFQYLVTLVWLVTRLNGLDSAALLHAKNNTFSCLVKSNSEVETSCTVIIPLIK